MYRSEFMDSMRLSSHFAEVASSFPKPESSIGPSSSMSDFMTYCRNNDIAAIKKLIPETSPSVLSLGLSAAIAEKHKDTVSYLTPHTQISLSHLHNAIKENAIELIDILDPTSEITQEYSRDLIYSAIAADNAGAISTLVQKGAKIDTAPHGDIYMAAMGGAYKALTALLQHVCYFENEEIIARITNKLEPQVADTLKQAAAKQKLLETLHQYKIYSQPQGTVPARPTNNKVRKFAINTIATMMNSKTPILTQNAIDDFHENKYQKRQAEPKKHGRHTPF